MIRRRTESRRFARNAGDHRITRTDACNANSRPPCFSLSTTTTLRSHSGKPQRHQSLPNRVPTMSFLSIVEKVDSFPAHDDFYWHFLAHDSTLLGYILPDIANKLGRFSHCFVCNTDQRSVAFAPNLTEFAARNTAFALVAETLRAEDPELARAWRAELYTVYHPHTVPYVLMERAASVLMGVVTYGVHMNGYIPASKTSDNTLKMWIPRRSATKSTYPGMLDNTVAGGLAHPYTIWENVVKECYEEAGLDSAFVEAHAKAAGVVSYLCQPSGPKGPPQPEVEYIYDIEFGSETDHVPQPVDGEAESFTLMSINEIRDRIMRGEFKPNCSLVLIDFMIRHGVLTVDNEPNYLQVMSHLHRRFPFPTRN